MQGLPPVISVGSCKGGVGKSTCAILCALALSKNFRVGLLDADLYGSSILEITDSLTQTSSFEPIAVGPLTCLSLSPARSQQPLIWRAPLLHKTLQTMLHAPIWETVDVLIVDLPPGTGDIALTLAQKAPLLGHILVTTPHHLAVQEGLLFAKFCKKLSLEMLGTIVNLCDLHTPSLHLQTLLSYSPLITEIGHSKDLSDASCTKAFLSVCKTIFAAHMRSICSTMSPHIRKRIAP